MEKEFYSKSSILGIAVILVAVISLLIAIFQINSFNKIAYADSSDISMSELCRQYTDSICPNGINFDEYVSDYIQTVDDCPPLDMSLIVSSSLRRGTLFSSNSQFSCAAHVVSAYVTDDDNIVKLIPKALFSQENKTIFVGKQYGFVIITEKITDTALKSSVVFLQIDKNVTDYLADIKVSVLTSADYVYLKQTESLALPTVSSASTKHFECRYELRSGVSPVVSVLPRTETVTLPDKKTDRLRYAESNDYMIGNISFAGQIRNQNDFNIGDSAYNANNDYGYFFVGNNYYYDCTMYEGNHKKTHKNYRL